ncbi:MAG TPA: hypothetical protein VJ302_38250 [Blastocatellia bacterium]|nr:hypothetical protein [Blastocatellia bacterium]
MIADRCQSALIGVNLQHIFYLDGDEMVLESFLLILLLTAICGAIGQALTGYSDRGIVSTIAVGFIGALLGIVLSGVLKLWELFPLSIGGFRFPVIWSIIGAIVISVLFDAILGRARHHG